MQAAIVRRMPWSCHNGEAARADQRLLATREWLVTNGLGGYASGTIGWSASRRYHGLLVAALPAPLGRMMMFNHLEEEFRLADGRVLRLSATAPCNPTRRDSAAALAEFRLEDGLPIWRYECGDYALERRVLLPYRSNTVHLTYRLVAGSAGAWLRLRPFLHFRPHEAAVSAPAAMPYFVVRWGIALRSHRPIFRRFASTCAGQRRRRCSTAADFMRWNMPSSAIAGTTIAARSGHRAIFVLT